METKREKTETDGYFYWGGVIINNTKLRKSGVTGSSSEFSLTE